MSKLSAARAVGSLLLAGALAAAVLLGTGAARSGSAAASPTVVILVQGIGSAATCGAEDDYAARARTVRARLDAGTAVVGFSYADRYSRAAGCAPAPAELVGTADATPHYSPAENCDGIASASARLDRLVQAVARANADAAVEIVGHSMGGMVAAHYLATANLASLAAVRSVVYLDAPLQGSSFAPGLLVQLFPNCPATSASWRDIAAGSEVERTIATRTCRAGVRQYSVIATSMGASLPCTTESRARTDIAGTFSELLPSALISAHAGIWSDPGALDAIVAASVAPATPPAAPPAAGPASGGRPPADGGIGLFVFAGGSDAELVTASGCPASTAAFWASDGQGGFVAYLPGAVVAVVNARWRAHFAAAIPAGTVLIGKCR